MVQSEPISNANNFQQMVLEAMMKLKQRLLAERLDGDDSSAMTLTVLTPTSEMSSHWADHSEGITIIHVSHDPVRRGFHRDGGSMP